MRKANLFLAVVCVVLVGLLVYELQGAYAAKPLGPTLIVTPSSPHVGDWLSFSGCGYEPGRGVGLLYTSPSATGYFSGGPADAAGCFNSGTYVGMYASPAGAWDVYSYQTYVGHHQQILADLDFEVNG